MLISSLNYYIIAALLYLAHTSPLFGFLSAFVVFRINRSTADKQNPTFRGKLFSLLSIPPIVILTAHIALPVIAKMEFGTAMTASISDMLWFAGCFTAGIVSAITLLRSGVQLLERTKGKLTQTNALERNKKTDVREINKFLPEPMPLYDVDRYIDFKQGTFLGLDEHKKPIYWPPGKPLPHVEVAGTTGSGKGVFIGMLISQNIGQGEAVFVIDPKDDEWLPHVVATAAKRYGKPYHFIDLRPGAPAQLNLFAGATADQIEELFLAGFGLSETGNPSDFYSIADRQAATFIAGEAVKPGATPGSICNEHMETILSMKAEKFAGYLKEMATIPAVNALEGVDLRRIVAEGGAVYVVGSMRNTKVMRLQKMLMIKLIHLAEERDRTGTVKPRPISVVLDEFIYHISKPVLEGLGAARDKGMHVTLAHQALADFARCGADLDKEAVMGAVMENCKLKLVYKIEDPETAEWLAQKSGKILVDDESRNVERNLALSEKVDDKRTIRQAERFFMDDNMIMNLHERLGIVFGLGLPRFSFSSPVKTVKSPDNLIPQSCDGALLQTASQSLDVSTTAAPVARDTVMQAAALLDVDEAEASSNPFPTTAIQLDTIAQEIDEQMLADSYNT